MQEMNMKRILVALCLVAAGFHFSIAQVKDVSAKNSRHLPQDQKFVDMEQTLWEAWKNKDRKPYEDALSANFFEVDATGTYDKTTEISYIDKCDLKDYAILDPRVAWLNKETALLTYRIRKWREAFHSEVPQSAAG
jgi:hypothetical protein